MAEDNSCSNEKILLIASIGAFVASETLGLLPIRQNGVIQALVAFLKTLPERLGHLPEFDVVESSPVAFSVV